MDQTKYVTAVQKYIDRSLRLDESAVNGPIFRGYPVYSVECDPRGTKSSPRYFVLFGKSNCPDLSYALNSRASRRKPHTITMDLPIERNTYRTTTFWIRPGAVLLPRPFRLDDSCVPVGCSCPDYQYNGQIAKLRDRGNLLGCKHMMLVSRKLGHDIVPTPAPPYQGIKTRLRFEPLDEDEDDGFDSI